MSAPAYVIIPVEGDAAQTGEQENIQGVKNNRRRFYDKYISWDDPLRTLCSYLGVLGVLIVAHCMPFTHLALKAGAITLGLTAAMEFASRTFGPDTFLTRLRPKPYKTIPEDTLNATLKDIHDFIQFSVREAQKIVFAQELDKTLLTAVALGTAYFLSQVLSPFAFSVLALTTVYIGSLAASSAPSDTSRVQNVARRATGSATPKSVHPAPEYPVTLKKEPHSHAEPAQSSAPAHPATVKEEAPMQHSESGAQHYQSDTAAGGQRQRQHQRRASGQELRETNFGHRRVRSRGSAEGSPTSPTKPFASSIPVATNLNGVYRHGGSN
ncbi:hypothetical protein B0T18DRAFT_492608, partial [Schizothecium vesticola]